MMTGAGGSTVHSKDNMGEVVSNQTVVDKDDVILLPDEEGNHEVKKIQGLHTYIALKLHTYIALTIGILLILDVS